MRRKDHLLSCVIPRTVVEIVVVMETRRTEGTNLVVSKIVVVTIMRGVVVTIMRDVVVIEVVVVVVIDVVSEVVIEVVIKVVIEDVANCSTSYELGVNLQKK